MTRWNIRNTAVDDPQTWRALIAKRGDEVLGRLTLSRSDRHAALTGLFVATGTAGPAILRALLYKAEAACRGAGIRELYIKAPATAVQQIRYYKHLGWQPLRAVDHILHLRKQL